MFIFTFALGIVGGNRRQKAPTEQMALLNDMMVGKYIIIKS